MVDVSKVKVGDKVLLKPAEVSRLLKSDSPYGGPIHLEIVTSNGARMTVSNDHVDKHIPAPRPFEKGDKVTWGSGNVVVDFVAEHYGRAVYFCPAAKTYGAEPIANIRHADAAVEDEIIVTDEEAKRAYDVYYGKSNPANNPKTNMRAALVDFVKRRRMAPK